MKSTLLSFLLLASWVVTAENMLKNGDFQQKGIEIMMHSGKLSYPKEGGDQSNTFARFSINKIYKTAQGHEVATATASLGVVNKIGFVCKPNTRYVFSVKMRSNNPQAVVGVNAAQWTAGSSKYKQLTTNISGGLPITTEWKEYKGSFVTENNASHAALILGIWWSTQVGPARYKVGDYLDVDDVMIKESSLITAEAVPALTGNLVKNGDFFKQNKEITVTGGSFAVAVEDANWNHYGRVTVNKIAKLADGNELVDSVIYIGGNDQVVFTCQPKTKYRFSMRIRASGAKTSVGVKIAESAQKMPLGKMKISDTSLRGGQNISNNWLTLKGHFTTGENTRFAALRLSMWWNTKYGPMRYKIGDTLDIDDIKIEIAPTIDSSISAAVPAPAVKIRKAAAPTHFTGEIKLDGKMDEVYWQKAFQASDFITFKNPEKAPAARTTFRLLANKDALYIGVIADEPLQVNTNVGKSRNVWESAALEFFFGDKSGNNRFLQLAIGANGGKYIGSDAGERQDKSSFDSAFSVEDHRWTVEVRIPWALLGTTADNTQAIPFNIARFRDYKLDYLTWSASRSLQAVKDYGMLIPAGFAPHVSRTAYEKAAAESALLAARKRHEQLSKRRVAAARVGITSDFTIPYMPDELFGSQLEKIWMRAAVNEIKSAAIAIANPSATMTEFRIVLEQTTSDTRNLNGTFGLKDFPAEQITLRRGVAVRDSNQATGSLLDPLVKLDEGSFITLPGQSAGLLWIDFDTRNVKPGTYTGILRILPMNQPVQMQRAQTSYFQRRYTSSELQIPITLQVDPIVLDTEPMHPGFYCSRTDSLAQFKLAVEAGQRYFMQTPYILFPLDKATGSFKPENPKAADMRMQFEYAKQCNVKIKFVLAYGAYYAFKAMYGIKEDDAKTITLWKNWIKTLYTYLKNNNIDAEDYYVELFDEPKETEFDTVIAATLAAKEAAPEMKILITLGYGKLPTEKLQKIAAAVDAWMLWTYGYPDTGHQQDFFKNLQKQGKELWHYTCDTDIRSSLDKNYRRNAWVTLAHGYDVSGLYQLYSAVNHNGMQDFLTVSSGEVAYTPTPDRAIPSLRFMALRQGMNDVKYFALLKKLGNGDPAVEKFIQDSAKEIAGKTADNHRADQLRSQAADMIMKLQGNK